MKFNENLLASSQFLQLFLMQSSTSRDSSKLYAVLVNTAKFGEIPQICTKFLDKKKLETGSRLTFVVLRVPKIDQSLNRFMSPSLSEVLVHDTITNFRQFCHRKFFYIRSNFDQFCEIWNPF